MNIDLLCGHETMLHCGCKACARNQALEEAAKTAQLHETNNPIRGFAEGYARAVSEIVENIRALKTGAK